MANIAKDILFGIAIGDALGVPYEFSSREQMRKSPATDIVGYKTHNQPPGTWSDDSSLTFCLAEVLTENYSLHSLARKFINWKKNAYWTARDKVFDIGITTSRSITKLEKILKNDADEDLDLLKYEASEYDNGNGSLMRILPLLLYIKNKNISEQFEIIWKNSALTHGHIRSAMSCLIYLKFAEFLTKGISKLESYQKTRIEIKTFWDEMNFSETEKTHFTRVIQNDISKYKEKSILSGGYVIESLEASLWCFLKTDTYESSILKAINFGHDTDTTAAITGGLSGIFYTYNKMPEYWIASLAKMEKIEELGNKLDLKYNL